MALSAPATAQEPGLTVAEWAALPRLLGLACVDLDPDSAGCEQAILLRSDTDPDSADLIILPHPTASDPAPLAVRRGIAFAGAFQGQQPQLEAADAQTLVLHEEQIAVGRTPWTRTTTILARGGALVIGHHTYDTYDRPTGGGFSCAVDFLERTWQWSAERTDPETGAVLSDVTQTGTLAPAWPVLAQWTRDRALPRPCRDALGAWFDASPL